MLATVEMDLEADRENSAECRRNWTLTLGVDVGRNE